MPFFVCTKIKAWLKYDDALDVFGVHGVGGTVGLILTGFLASPAANPNLANNLKLVVGHTLWMEQAKGIAVTLLLAAGGTAVIAWIVDRVMGLRATVETETEGLDVNEHGEEAYIFDAKS